MTQEEMLVAERLLSALVSIEEKLTEIKDELGSLKTRTDGDKILNVTQAAEMLGVTRQTVAMWIREGKLKKKVVAGKIGILKSDLLSSHPLN